MKTFLLLLISSFSITVFSQTTNSFSDNFPNQFGVNKSTIVVVLGKKEKDNETLRILGATHYNGKLFFSTEEELNTTFSNTQEYNYLLRFEKNGVYSMYNNLPLKGTIFTIIDRKNNSEYRTLVSSFFKLGTKQYFQKLQKVVEQNNEIK